MFLHGGLLHIAGNMLFLWIFGDNLEEALGHAGFLVFYFACGIAAALAQALPDPGSTVPMVGASGAVAGVMGGYLLLFPRVDVLIILIIIIRAMTLPAWLMLGLWFGIQALSGYAASAWPREASPISPMSAASRPGWHFTLPRWLRLGGPGFWRRTHGHPPHPPTPGGAGHIDPDRAASPLEEGVAWKPRLDPGIWSSAPRRASRTAQGGLRRQDRRSATPPTDPRLTTARIRRRSYRARFPTNARC